MIYYPYLRGKQFELIAIREIAQEYPGMTKICPIIEPVKLAFNGLKSAITKMFEGDMKFALVINPLEGDFKEENINMLNALPELRLYRERWIPAIIYKSANQLRQLMESYDSDEWMLIFKSSPDTADEYLMEILKAGRIKYIVAEFSNTSRRRLSHLKHLKLIRLDDKFNAQSRNADYANLIDELFSDEYFFASDEGYDGCADYTILPGAYKDSGMLPYAVAIHMTYLRSEEEVNIRHFVSDSNSDTSDIAGKFFEAAVKLKTFFEEHPSRTPACQEIIDMIANDRYPGLGVLKKLSIKHHLQLAERFL
ncbi:MAG: sce7725 family protein [Bacteroides sp.]|nr:sce7725 family protein [Bacteroides sp.]